jgi:hypothetical protein
VDPVPYSLLRKSGSVRNRTRDHWICSTLTTRQQRQSYLKSQRPKNTHVKLQFYVWRMYGCETWRGNRILRYFENRKLWKIFVRGISKAELTWRHYVRIWDMDFRATVANRYTNRTCSSVLIANYLAHYTSLTVILSHIYIHSNQFYPFSVGDLRFGFCISANGLGCSAPLTTPTYIY